MGVDRGGRCVSEGVLGESFNNFSLAELSNTSRCRAVVVCRVYSRVSGVPVRSIIGIAHYRGYVCGHGAITKNVVSYRGGAELMGPSRFYKFKGRGGRRT